MTAVRPGDHEPSVAILMGSDSDLAVMKAAADVLDRFGVRHEVHVLSAHRSPERVSAFVRAAPQRGVAVFIAGAGMAAHLAGVVAAHTGLPVIGVPLSGRREAGGIDALYSTVQMPPGVPVATVGIDAAGNAGHLAARILALGDPALAARVAEHRRAMDEEIAVKDGRLSELGVDGYLAARG